MKVKTFASATLFAAALTVASAAHAEGFSGPRVGAEIGIVDDDFLGDSDTSWGINAGYDVDLGNLVAGGTLAYNDVFDDDFNQRELSLSARLGPKLSERALLYGTVGYSNLKSAGFKFDGVKVGAGLEFNVTKNVYVNAETRYGNYEAGAELYQTVAGVGFRF